MKNLETKLANCPYCNFSFLKENGIHLPFVYRDKIGIVVLDNRLGNYQVKFLGQEIALGELVHFFCPKCDKSLAYPTLHDPYFRIIVSFHGFPKDAILHRQYGKHFTLVFQKDFIVYENSTLEEKEEFLKRLHIYLFQKQGFCFLG